MYKILCKKYENVLYQTLKSREQYVMKLHNMGDWNLQEWKMTDHQKGAVEFAGLENDGLENDGVEHTRANVYTAYDEKL